MNQGVIRYLKAHYQRRNVRLLCRALEKNELYPKISILQGVKILTNFWEAAAKKTIISQLFQEGWNQP